MRRVDEALAAHVSDQGIEWIPEAIDIGEHHRLGVAAKLGPGHDLDDLLQGSDAAGQGHESI